MPNVIFRRSRRELGFFHRGMCVLLAWVMFISPEMFNQLSDAAVDYEQLGTSSWGQVDRTITYTYDDNGSLKEKRLSPTGISFPIEVVYYTYDAANRLIKIEVIPSRYIKNYVEYTYNDDGIRVSAYSYTTNVNGPAENEKTVIYLTDSYNHTGYSQALEELTFNKAAPDLQADTPDSVRTYLLGDDCIAQRTDGDMQYLLYDGHGSTRQLAYYTGTDIAIADNYSYDGYGVFLQDDYYLTPIAVRTLPQQTSLLYAGEHFDFNAQQYYNRARWYNPLSGLFNQVDPYAGNLHDPQSLHKYLYCHANPINNIDPTGKFIGSIADAMGTMLIRATLSVMENGPKLFAYTWAAFKITGAMWLATMSLLILQELGVLPHDELVAEVGAILGLVLIAELFVLSLIPTGFTSPPNHPRGMNDPRVKQAVNIGIRAHYDKTTDPTRYTHEGCPTQLKRIYNQNTEFWFAKRGQAGPDVKWIGGPHPSTYPSSKWPSGINQADFKPNTPTGNAFKLPPNTLRIPYDPQTGQIKH
ncbi:MAG: RHS repeat-associated core domain-containing protein [Phycisphaerae bacterium]